MIKASALPSRRSGQAISGRRAALRCRGAPAGEPPLRRDEPVSLLSRAFGVRPRRPHGVRVERDLVIPAGDGVPLLANRFYPADIDQAPLVLLRSPYGRGAALDRMPQLLAERGYQVLYVSLRGTGGSGGEFDGFRIDPADADGMLAWLREQPWFGGVLATCGASYLGYRPVGARRPRHPGMEDRGHPGRAVGVRPSVHVSGRRIRAGQRVGWVQIVDRMFRTGGRDGPPGPRGVHRPRCAARWPRCLSPTPTSR